MYLALFIYSFFSRSSWLKMCVDIAVLLRAVVQSQCDTTLPYLLKEEEMGQLCKVLTCIRMLHDCREGTYRHAYKIGASIYGRHIYLTLSSDYDCLSLCSAIMALLQSIVDRLPRSKAEIVFSPIQMQWDSFTGPLMTLIVNSYMYSHYIFIFPQGWYTMDYLTLRPSPLYNLTA